MNDKGQKKLAEGHLARKGRALQSIQEILGIDQQAYDAWIDEMPPKERATHDAQVERYMEVCTIMSTEHIQWSSQLMLGAPENVVSLSTNQSSMISALGAVLLEELNQPSGKAVPQHLRKAGKQIERLTSAKKRYLDELYSQLRPDERKDYGNLLKVCSPLLCAMPDLALYETFGRVDLAWKFRSSLIIKPQPGVPESGMIAAFTKLHKRVTQLSSQALSPILTRSVTDKKDSLAAKLMLATLVNRSHWELLELERLEEIAATGLLRLVASLANSGYARVPAEVSRDQFRLWLKKEFCADSFGGEENWRPLKPRHLDRFYKQALWILRWEKLDFVEHREKDNALLNLCVLGMVWSYCTHEKHDVRVPNVKDYDLVSGRDVERGELVPLTRIMYQQRQLNILTRSQQHFALSTSKMEIQVALSKVGRQERMAYLRSNLRNTSLAQWKELAEGIYEVMTPLLLGQSNVISPAAESRS